MPVTVVPVAELLRDLTQQALAEDRKRADHIPVSQALRWFSDGYREIVRRVQFLTSTYTADLQPSVQQPAPADILDRLIPDANALRIKSATGHWHPLNLRDWTYIREVYPDFTTLTSPGCSHDWGWDETTPGQLLVLPPPSSDITRGLCFDYIQDPGPLTRLYDDDAATCAVVNGSATVSFGFSIAGLVAAGDVFGVKASSDELPASWYKVASVATDLQHATLSEPWADVSNASALFTLSQVSLCEWTRPGLCLFAPVAYALYHYWLREDQARANDYLVAFYGGTAKPGTKLAYQVDGELTRIAKAAGDRNGVVYQDRNHAASYAGIRSRMSFTTRAPYRR